MAKKASIAKLQQGSPNFDSDYAENVFTDIVQVNVTSETVSMSIAIRSKDGKSAKVSHNIIMTLPHFMRFTEVCNNIASDTLKRIKNARKEVINLK